MSQLTLHIVRFDFTWIVYLALSTDYVSSVSVVDDAAVLDILSPSRYSVRSVVSLKRNCWLLFAFKTLPCLDLLNSPHAVLISSCKAG